MLTEPSWVSPGGGVNGGIRKPRIGLQEPVDSETVPQLHLEIFRVPGELELQEGVRGFVEGLVCLCSELEAESERVPADTRRLITGDGGSSKRFQATLQSPVPLTRRPQLTSIHHSPFRVEVSRRDVQEGRLLEISL
jgi:hypothetical protein